MRPIRTGIVGYGNLGQSVETVIASQPDMALHGVFSRRTQLDIQAPVFAVNELAEQAENLDVLFLCLGSATDIPAQAPELVKHACTVDTYDNHSDILNHRQRMQEAAQQAGHTAIVATGWDPGLFSLNRSLAAAILPNHQQHSFWGPGLSQGHSNAVRRIEGVKKAVQYTLPAQEAVEAARRGEAGQLSARQAHVRQCWVVADPQDQPRIEDEIRNMPDYFVGYQVEVNFIDEQTFDRDHSGMPHGGHIITTGRIGQSQHTVNFTLELERNPDFTAAVQVAYGRAACRMHQQGQIGAYTVLEVAPGLLSPTPIEDLIAKDV